MSFVWPQNNYTLNELISKARGPLCFEGLVEKILLSLGIIQGMQERGRWGINPTLVSYITLTLLTHLSQEINFLHGKVTVRIY